MPFAHMSGVGKTVAAAAGGQRWRILRNPLYAAWKETFAALTPAGESEEKACKVRDAYWGFMAAEYGSGHRAYHTLRHVEELLGLASQYADQINDLPSVQSAIFFHEYAVP